MLNAAIPRGLLALVSHTLAKLLILMLANLFATLLNYASHVTVSCSYPRGLEARAKAVAVRKQTL